MVYQSESELNTLMQPSGRKIFYVTIEVRTQNAHPISLWRILY